MPLPALVVPDGHRAEGRVPEGQSGAQLRSGRDFVNQLFPKYDEVRVVTLPGDTVRVPNLEGIGPKGVPEVAKTGKANMNEASVLSPPEARRPPRTKSSLTPSAGAGRRTLRFMDDRATRDQSPRSSVACDGRIDLTLALRPLMGVCPEPTKPAERPLRSVPPCRAGRRLSLSDHIGAGALPHSPSPQVPTHSEVLNMVAAHLGLDDSDPEDNEDEVPRLTLTHTAAPSVCGSMLAVAPNGPESLSLDEALEHPFMVCEVVDMGDVVPDAVQAYRTANGGPTIRPKTPADAYLAVAALQRAHSGRSAPPPVAAIVVEPDAANSCPAQAVDRLPDSTILPADAPPAACVVVEDKKGKRLKVQLHLPSTAPPL